MPDPAHNTQLNKELRLHVAALLYFLSRLAVTVFVFAVPALYFTAGMVELPYVIGGAVFVGALFLGYYVASAPLRCVACGSPVLMDNGNRKHPHAARFPGFNHRARVAWDILFSSSYQCMYCVTRCRCKKSWGGRSKNNPRAATFQSPLRPAAADSPFPGSIFGDVGEPVTNGDAGFPGAAMPQAGAEVPAPQNERVVTNVFAAASAFPNARTVPVALVNPPTGPVPAPQPATSSTVAVPQEVIIDAPAPAPSFPVPRTTPSAPVPWSIPVPDSPLLVKDSNMNQQPFHEPAAAVPANPFLAAAAAMPPPPTPALPPIPAAKTRPATEPAPHPFQAEFPYSPPTVPSDGPPPWTIPSMPVDHAAAPSPFTIPAAPAPAAPAPVTPQPAVPAPVAATTGPLAPSHQQAQLLKDVVNVLEEGQRTLASAFENMISRLGSHLSVLAQAPAPAPVAPAAPVAIPAPVPATAPVAAEMPPAPTPFVQPVPAPPAAVEMPAPLAAPAPIPPVQVAAPVPVAPTAPVQPVFAPPAAIPAPVAASVPVPAPVIPSAPELPDLLAMRPPPSPVQMRQPSGKPGLESVPVLPPVPPSLIQPVAPVASPFSVVTPAPAPAPAPAPVLPPPPAAIPAPQPPPAVAAEVPALAPIEPVAPHLQVPAMHAAPVPPVAPAPVPAPATAPAPAAESPAAPRRRFIRPSSMVSQEINQMLQETFSPDSMSAGAAPAPVATPSAPVPMPQAPVPAPHAWPYQGSGNGHSAPVPVTPAAHPYTMPPALEPAAQMLPQRQTAPAPSPFGLSETPLYAPPGAPQEPAPFTFLTNEGGQFTPPPPAPGDPLDDSIMPWMQPVGPAHPRSN